ncbi:MAG TPA: serine hydrolase domain-containing protein [Gaiellaceae bacterium]|nr:serine hydrolase domain-containing protein [Gaiellaceae bacterium]
MVEPVSSDELAACVREARARWSIPGMAVGVLHDGETVTAADGTRPSDVFRIASVSKPFLATLVMSLVEDGLVDLDEPPAGTRVSATLRQLLSHQGGLACEWPTPLAEFGDDDEALLRLAAGEPRLLPFAPGELFSYSNAGYWLVGAAAARASGTSFEEAMRARVLEPLGLSSTGYEPRDAVPGHVQVAPGADEHRPIEDNYPRVRNPSGGLTSTVEDVLRFATHHFDREELQQPVVSGPGFEHGLGWVLRERGGHRSVEHSGDAAGYQSLLVLIPSTRTAFAALTNSSRGAAAIRDVLDRLGLSPTEAPDYPLEPEQLAAVAGTYRAPGVRLALTPNGRYLALSYRERDVFRGEWDEYPTMRLRPVGEREFEIVEGEWTGERLGFPRKDVALFGIAAQRVE